MIPGQNVLRAQNWHGVGGLKPTLEDKRIPATLGIRAQAYDFVNRPQFPADLPAGGFANGARYLEIGGAMGLRIIKLSTVTLLPSSAQPSFLTLAISKAPYWGPGTVSSWSGQIVGGGTAFCCSVALVDSMSPQFLLFSRTTINKKYELPNLGSAGIKLSAIGKFELVVQAGGGTAVKATYEVMDFGFFTPAAYVSMLTSPPEFQHAQAMLKQWAAGSGANKWKVWVGSNNANPSGFMFSDLSLIDQAKARIVETPFSCQDCVNMISLLALTVGFVPGKPNETYPVFTIGGFSKFGPFLLDQQGWNFCGQFSLLFSMARKYPAQYIQFCQNLVSKGVIIDASGKTWVAPKNLLGNPGGVLQETIFNKDCFGASQLDLLCSVALSSFAGQQPLPKPLNPKTAFGTNPQVMHNWVQKVLGLPAAKTLYKVKWQDLPAIQEATMLNKIVIGHFFLDKAKMIYLGLPFSTAPWSSPTQHTAAILGISFLDGGYKLASFGSAYLATVFFHTNNSVVALFLTKASISAFAACEMES